jgi:release factor glutamine methyltransferase
VLRAATRRLRDAGLPTARQDAELLLARVLGTTRLALYLEPERELAPDELVAFEAFLVRRLGQEPLQYVLGEAEFFGLSLAVGPGAFVPRPETELLVERALAGCPTGPAIALDLGTGTGAVACALAVRRPLLSIWAVEVDGDAVPWARRNVTRLGLGDRVRILEGDLTAPLAGLGLEGRCDLVVANPPYIPRPALSSLPEEVRAFEPARALDGGADGLAVIRRVLREAPGFLRPRGWLGLEIGHDHAGRVRAALAGDPRYGPAAFVRDLSGYERVLEVGVL